MIVDKRVFKYADAECLLALNFKIEDQKEHYKVHLPINWYFNIIKKNKYLFFDEKNRCRGEYIINPKKGYGRIFLYPRYSIMYEKSYIFIYDRNTKIKVVSLRIRPFEKRKKEKILKNYLNKKHPNWKKPLAYWN